MVITRKVYRVRKDFLFHKGELGTTQIPLKHGRPITEDGEAKNIKIIK